MAPVRTANRRTTGVMTKVPPALVAKTMRYEIKRPFRSRVRGEPRHEVADPRPRLVLHALLGSTSEHLTDDARHLLHLGLVHAEGGRTRRPHADPARLERWQRVERDRV